MAEIVPKPTQELLLVVVVTSIKYYPEECEVLAITDDHPTFPLLIGPL